MLYSADGGDEEICGGLCLAGKKALWIGINKMLVAVGHITSGTDDLYDQQTNRISDLEAQLKRAKDGADELRKEIRDLDKLLTDNNIERPTECLNCGKKKAECEDFGGKLLHPRMGSFGKSKYANDFYLTSIGTWEKCEHPEKSNGGQYRETEGGMITYFGNAWNTCSKQEGDEGLCMECSMATLGMLTPKYDRRIDGCVKQVAGFQYSVPRCCFHMGCADECGIMWKKTTQLICPQIANIPKMNASPMDARRGVLPPISPSMVKITGQFASMDVRVGGRGIDGSGNLYPNQIARWEGETTDTTMRDLINRHLARGRTHAEQQQVAVADNVVAQELEAELMEDDSDYRPADPIVFATLITDTDSQILPQQNTIQPAPTHRRHHDRNYPYFQQYTSGNGIIYDVYGAEGLTINGHPNFIAYQGETFYCGGSSWAELLDNIASWEAPTSSDSEDEE